MHFNLCKFGRIISYEFVTSHRHFQHSKKLNSVAALALSCFADSFFNQLHFEKWSLSRTTSFWTIFGMFRVI